jgi:hypothetical protein
MHEVNYIPALPAANQLAHVMAEFVNGLCRQFPGSECVMEEAGYGDEDIVVRVYGEPRQLNAISNTAAQLSADLDARYDVFILVLVSPIADCPVKA